MPVTNPDDRYLLHAEQWERTRDAYLGQRFVHAKGEKYLPKVGHAMKENTKEGRQLYEEYKNRTLFFNATGNTVDGLVGLIFRKDPINKLTPNTEYLRESVDLTNTTLKEFQELACKEAVMNDYVGVHTTMPEVEAGMSKLDAERKNIKPYLTMYKAEDIIKVYYSQHKNINKIDLIVLRETIQVESGDEFNRIDRFQYRVLDMYQEKNELGEAIGSPVYRERLYDHGGSLVDSTIPRMNRKPFDYIPFEIITINGTGKSIIEDLVHANYNHYQMNASYTWGVHQTGFPTPTITGIDSEEIPNDIGPGTVWVSSRDETKFDILEAKAGSADKGKMFLDKVELYMSSLGAELLKPMKMGSETAESKRLDKQAQYSSLSTVSQLVGAGIQRAVKIAAQWVGDNSDDVVISLNRDYYPASMNAQMLHALVGALQSGSISYETFWENLQRGEVADATKSSEDEKDIIDKQDPMGMPSFSRSNSSMSVTPPNNTNGIDENGGGG